MDWQLLFLSIVCCATIADQASSKYFCVSELNSNDGFCQQHNSIESHTLAYYMNNSRRYFNSYDTYVFQPGLHTPLDRFILNISNVTNLSFIGPGGAKSAVVNCNGKSTGFMFRFSSNICIENITFFACERKHSTKKIEYSTLSFQAGMHVSLLGVTLLMSVNEAFAIENVVGEVVLNNVKVKHSNTGGRKVHNAGNIIEYHHCNSPNKTTVYITNSRFVNNSNYVNPSNTYAAGLTISLHCAGIEVKMYNVTMLNNTGYAGGNLALRFYSYLNHFNVSAEIGHCHFEGGSGTDGGGMHTEFTDISQSSMITCKASSKERLLLRVYDTNFTNNVARYSGGGVHLVQTPSISSCFIERIAFENVVFNNNSVIITGHGGIAIHSQSRMRDLLHVIPQFHLIFVNCSIHNNYKPHRRDGSGTATVFVKSNRYFLLKNTAIFCNEVTGILATSSNIILSHNITIVNNTGSSGGGLLFCQNAVMYLKTHTNVTIAHNTANHTGGGIYVETGCLVSMPLCFFQLFKYPQVLPSNINISVYNNHAHFAGNNIFGGSIDNCYMMKKPPRTKGIDVYKTIFNIISNTISPASVSSPPRHVCLCKNNRPICIYNMQVSQISHTIEKFPGETFSIEAVLVGQFSGTVPGTVQAWLINKRNYNFGPNENIQKISTRTCTKLNYTIYSHDSHEVLALGAQVPGDVSGLEQLNQFQKYLINITLKECPLGFLRTNGKKSYCGCNRLFRHHNSHITCDIKNHTIKRVPPVWIGFIDGNTQSKVVAYHSHCPLDYCLSEDIYLHASETLFSQDEQCAFNRTGVLCGSCSEGFSSVLGSSQCHYCSNYWLLVLFPFALLGIILVLGLTLFNITIAEGTLSGIIFYCNIVGGNYSIFFQGQNIQFFTSFLKTFVLLINLETGIPLCLFDGLDAYTKAWLNFAFPLYIWLITGVFIWLGGRCSWIIKHNAVKVLATLILLSYARLLSAVSEALQISYVHLENGNSEQRWLIDGNIKYFQGKHIPLATFAILFSVLLFPFALCLCFLQCLQKGSHYLLFSWVNRLKPFFDAYTGPFTSSGRFWTGLLLFSRGILFVVSAVNTKGDPGTILGTTTLVVIFLLLVAWIVPAGLYRWQSLNMLECFSLINLGALASLLFIFETGNAYSALVSHICVGTNLFVFIGVISYHILSLKPVKRIIQRACCCPRLAHYGQVWRNKVIEDDDVPIINFQNPYAEGSEPLLNNN